MKSLLIFFLALLIMPLRLLAEYNGHQIEFRVEMADGESFFGYNYLSDLGNPDSSLTYKEFLEQNYELVLRNQFNDLKAEWTYFKYRIKYEYQDYDGEKRAIHVLTDKVAINRLEIQSFEIIEMIDQSYLIGVSSAHSWEDRNWMNKAPVDVVRTGGYLCDHQVFFHDDDPNAERIKIELESALAEFEEAVKEQRSIMEYSDGETYYEAENRIDDLENGIDEKIADILARFDGMKVVVISMCTC